MLCLFTGIIVGVRINSSLNSKLTSINEFSDSFLSVLRLLRPTDIPLPYRSEVTIVSLKKSNLRNVKLGILSIKFVINCVKFSYPSNYLSTSFLIYLWFNDRSEIHI